MLVHFVGSRYNVVENIDHLRRLVTAIHEEGHKLASDWIEPAYLSESKDGPAGMKWNEIYKESIEAITKADVVVVEASTRGFGIGYQAAMAVQQKKPTLVLCQKDASDSFFASGIEVGVTYREYDDKNVIDIIKEFLRENDIQAKDMRFNFFIDRPIYNYLRWAAFKSGRTKAEILRELVMREIDKDKKDY